MDKNRIYIREENLDKIIDEQWKKWEEEGYNHICIGLKEKFPSNNSDIWFREVFEELDYQTRKSLEGDPSLTDLPEDMIEFV